MEPVRRFNRKTAKASPYIGEVLDAAFAKKIHDEVLVCLAVWCDKWEDWSEKEDIDIYLTENFNIAPTRAAILTGEALKRLTRIKYVTRAVPNRTLYTHLYRTFIPTPTPTYIYAITTRGKDYLVETGLYNMKEKPFSPGPIEMAMIVGPSATTLRA